VSQPVDNRSDEELDLLVAQVRGCKPMKSQYGGLYCPCAGMPHGMAGVYINPTKSLPPRLHRLPKDIALGFLKGNGVNAEQVKPSKDGIALCTVMMNAHGNIELKTAIPVKARSFELLLAIRGALKTLDSNMHEAMSAFKKGLPPGDEIDKLLDEAGGIDQEPEEPAW
jgi:hypothetical protein